MKFATVFFLAALLTVTAADFTLPTLDKICTKKLSNPYDCNGSYEASALYLSDYTKRKNDPELLYRGACGTQPYFDANLAGDEFALMTDIGEYALENITSSRAFNYNNTVGEDNVFFNTVPAIVGHTYAVLVSRDDLRALYVLKVSEIVPDQGISFDYAVRSYSIFDVVQESPGFSWTEENDNRPGQCGL